jgi:O-methyltransferase domain/Dimerisation domain
MTKVLDAGPGRRQIELLKTAEGFFDAQILFTANELGVFGGLAEAPRSSSDLAQATGADHDALVRLLNGCVAIGLLRLDGDRYANADLAQEVLVPGRPGYLGNWLRLLSLWMSKWASLTETVRSGQRADVPLPHLGDDPDYTRDFVLGMDDYARMRGAEIVRYLDFNGARELIDIGGGPGSYAVIFVNEWPDLHATVFDLPDIVPFAERRAQEAAVADRISIKPGNYYEDEFGSGYDVAFLSDTLHQESPEACEMILKKAYRSLRPGGQIVVQAMFLNEDHVSPRWPVVLSLNLLLIYGGGRSYTVGETVSLIERAGFVDCTHRRMSLLNVNSLITARKP